MVQVLVESHAHSVHSAHGMHPHRLTFQTTTLGPWVPRSMRHAIDPPITEHDCFLDTIDDEPHFDTHLHSDIPLVRTFVTSEFEESDETILTPAHPLPPVEPRVEPRNIPIVHIPMVEFENFEQDMEALDDEMERLSDLMNLLERSHTAVRALPPVRQYYESTWRSHAHSHSHTEDVVHDSQQPRMAYMMHQESYTDTQADEDDESVPPLLSFSEFQQVDVNDLEFPAHQRTPASMGRVERLQALTYTFHRAPERLGFSETIHDDFLDTESKDDEEEEYYPQYLDEDDDDSEDLNEDLDDDMDDEYLFDKDEAQFVKQFLDANGLPCTSFEECALNSRGRAVSHKHCFQCETKRTPGFNADGEFVDLNLSELVHHVHHRVCHCGSSVPGR